VRSGYAAKLPLVSFRGKSKIQTLLPGCQKNFQKFQIAGCKNAFPDAYPLRGVFSNRRTAHGTKCEVCANRRNQKSLSAKGAKTPFSPATPWEDFNKKASRRKKFAEQLVKTVFSPATPWEDFYERRKSHKSKVP
jgi:hypothetical protein